MGKTIIALVGVLLLLPTVVLAQDTRCDRYGSSLYCSTTPAPRGSGGISSFGEGFLEGRERARQQRQELMQEYMMEQQLEIQRQQLRQLELQRQQAERQEAERQRLEREADRYTRNYRPQVPLYYYGPDSEGRMWACDASECRTLAK